MNSCMFLPREWQKPLPSDDERSIHIREILKLRAGDTLKIGLTGRGMGVARLLNDPPRKGNLELEFPPMETLIPRLGGRLSLIIGHPRPPVFKRLLRDLSGMGVLRVLWVFSRLSEKSYLQSTAWNPESIQRNIILGLSQGGYSREPEIRKYYSLTSCLSDTQELGKDSVRKTLLHPGKSAPVLSDVFFPPDRGRGSSPEDTPEDVIAIGPERGWTDEELEQFSTSGFRPATLGPAILRTETAAHLVAGMHTLLASHQGEEQLNES